METLWKSRCLNDWARIDYMKRRGQYQRMRQMAIVAAALVAWAGALGPCAAQDDASAPVAVPALRSSGELDQILGPIALYPDPLIGVLLPASAVPSQIVLADRYVSQGGDPGQIAVQPWDASVQGLAHYPTVLKWMDDNLAWTTELGVAFTSQQADVMDSIQRLRGQAQALGNLQTTPQENVVSDDGIIDIDPADPDDIYVPDYQPNLIYDQSGVYCSFGIGLPIGVWLGFDWDWRHHHLISWGPGHPRPRGWWQRPPAERRGEITAQSPGLWRPRTPAASIIVRGGGDRGYEAGHFSGSYLAPKVAAPREVSRPSRAPEVRAAEISSPREAARPVERREPTESAFGGTQSSREVRESSSRGQESRSQSVEPAHPSGGSRGHR